MNGTFEADGAADTALLDKIRKDGLLRILSVLDQQYACLGAIKGRADAPEAGVGGELPEAAQSRGRHRLPRR